MFKKFKFIFVLVLSLFVVACKPGDDVNDETDPNQATLEAWVDSVIPDLINDDIALPQTHPTLGGMVIWNSNKAGFDYDGNYVRPAVTEDITITVQVIIGAKTYNISIDTIIEGDMATIDYIANWFAESKVEANKINSDVTDIVFPTTHPVFGGEIAWTSTNEALLANDGTYTRPADDTTVVINYTVTYNGETKSYTADALVGGVPATLKFNEAREWILTQIPSGELTEEDVLPTSYEPYDISIAWTTFGSSIVSTDGTVKKPLYDVKASLTATLTLPNTVKMTVTYDFIVEGETKVFENQWEAVELLLSKIEKQTVSNLKYYTYGFEAGYEKMENTCYGYIPFYVAPMYTLHEEIIRVLLIIDQDMLKHLLNLLQFMIQQLQQLQKYIMIHI